jgi:hypothetical protein
MAGHVHNGADHRTALRRLDWCLTLIEESRQRGATALDPALVPALQPYVPGVHANMALSTAATTVLRLQEAHLQPPEQDSPAATGTPLGRDEARALTERIKASATDLCRLLLDAHSGRAWQSLGYPSWEQYVRTEFRLSRARSYELLDRGRVTRALEDVVGVSGVPDISTSTAVHVKRELPEVLAAVRARVVGRPVAEVRHIVADVVREHRGHQGRHPRGRTVAGDADRVTFSQAIALLAAMPAPSEALHLVAGGEGRGGLREIRAAHRWLSELITLCDAGHGPSARSVDAPRQRGDTTLTRRGRGETVAPRIQNERRSFPQEDVTVAARHTASVEKGEERVSIHISGPGLGNVNSKLLEGCAQALAACAAENACFEKGVSVACLGTIATHDRESRCVSQAFGLAAR